MNSKQSSRRNLIGRGAALSAAAFSIAAAAARAADAEGAPRGKAHSKNIDLILAFCKAGERRDVDAQMGMIAKDGVYHNMPDDPIKGEAQIRALLSGYITGTDASEIVVLNIAEAPSGAVLTERVDRFRVKDKWIECPVMGTARIENGKIKEWRDYYDNLRLRAQMT